MASTLEVLLLTQVSTLLTSIPQLLSTVTLAATTASVSYTVVTPYPRLLVNWGGMTTGTGAQQLWLRLNADSAAHYNTSYVQNATSTVSGATTSAQNQIQAGIINGSGSTADYWSSGSFLIEGAAQSNHFPTAVGTSIAYETASTSWIGTFGGIYLTAAPITSVTLLPASGSFAAGGSFSFYGLS